ncbi:hypothetical protein RRG08_060489 [Elysia crispata]|uniref:Uncharacterized protein n=1 Tax=Elysia crispata TaxID=231223 RepID=A0AAE1E873_9GAST|nr:hypothetical protein RRG08_060489 [Elysia crispata]
MPFRNTKGILGTSPAPMRSLYSSCSIFTFRSEISRISKLPLLRYIQRTTLRGITHPLKEIPLVEHALNKANGLESRKADREAQQHHSGNYWHRPYWLATPPDPARNSETEILVLGHTLVSISHAHA